MFFVLMAMQANHHIIELGKTLAAEEKAGCDDTASAQGISAFLREWQSQNPQALHEPVVQGVLDALDGYSDLSHART